MKPIQEAQGDIWQQISIPHWMMENFNNLQEPSVFFDSVEQQPKEKPSIQKSDENNRQNNKLEGESANLYKRKHPLSYQVFYQGQREEEFKQIDNLSDSQEEQNRQAQQNKYSVQELLKGDKDDNTNKKQRRCQNSKKYRDKKKQYFKSLEEQNRFLKFKVDELSFRIRQLQTQINKFKNATEQPYRMQSFHTIKSQCLQQLEKMLQNKETSQQDYVNMQKRLRSVNSFDGKQKLDLLNYFMSELMENVVNDRVFYSLDCLINKRGFHRSDQSVPLRRIDMEVLTILNMQDLEKQAFLKLKQQQILLVEAKKFQQIWKKLYQVYLAILNQGFRMQSCVQPMKKQLLSFVKLQNFLRLQLHFEKNKFRPDIRKMRNLWFQELQVENSSTIADSSEQKKYQLKHSSKKIKLLNG